MQKQIKEIIRSVIREEFISELSKNDIHVKEIMKFYDKGTYSTKKAVSIFVSGKTNATRNRILDDLGDMGYNEIWDVMDHFKLKIESVNEITLNEGLGDSIKKIKNLAIKMATTKYDRAKSHLNVDKIASADDFIAIGIPAEWIPVLNNMGFKSVEELKAGNPNKVFNDLGGMRKKMKLEIVMPSKESVMEWFS